MVYELIETFVLTEFGSHTNDAKFPRSGNVQKRNPGMVLMLLKWCVFLLFYSFSIFSSNSRLNKLESS